MTAREEYEKSVEFADRFDPMEALEKADAALAEADQDLAAAREKTEFWHKRNHDLVEEARKLADAIRKHPHSREIEDILARYQTEEEK